VSKALTPAEILEDQIDLRAQALACIAAWLVRDQEGFDAAAGTPEESQVVLQVVIMELTSALEKLVGRSELLWQVGNWLDEHAARMSERN
jgi:hypothetical protein